MKTKLTAIFHDGRVKHRTTARTYAAAWRAVGPDRFEIASGFTNELNPRDAVYWRARGYQIDISIRVVAGPLSDADLAEIAALREHAAAARAGNQ